MAIDLGVVRRAEEIGRMVAPAAVGISLKIVSGQGARFWGRLWDEDLAAVWDRWRGGDCCADGYFGADWMTDTHGLP
ncbi:hypothetical protein DSM3645_22119 [Blastopirellula marina DSM 3645]|uniref:Uncharacterized protein n=1 Tax=Blastopirellula marina DSM 3645 TaxID=314230 RepID=A3ZUH2_9BACT|nr:hypothetical protein DSM3645_22119 [Blastopirellula marina DSM 3645]